MPRLISPIADYVSRKPTRIPIIVSTTGIVLAALLSSLMVALGLHHNGTLFILMATGLAASLAIPAGTVHYSREIQIARQQERLKTLASTDALTGVMNRRTFESAVEKEQARMRRTGEQAALILFDIDWFKSINDSFGHTAGDEVLKTVADLANNVLRKPLDALSRWGGEEFAILLTAVTPSQAYDVSERLRQVIANATFDDIAPGLSASASFGVRTLTSTCSLHNALIDADYALYEAKKSGRNQTVCAAQPAKPLRVIARAS